MGRADKKKAAAHATAARIKAHNSTSTNLKNHNPSADTNILPITVDSDSDSDCQYLGGVNFYPSDDDYTDSGEESTDTELESLAELEGDELEANLRELRAELEDLGTIHTKYDHIMQMKSVTDWKKAERNRTLGYTGNSRRTQLRKAKEAREREALRTEAQTS